MDPSLFSVQFFPSSSLYWLNCLVIHNGTSFISGFFCWLHLQYQIQLWCTHFIQRYFLVLCGIFSAGNEMIFWSTLYEPEYFVLNVDISKMATGTFRRFFCNQFCEAASVPLIGFVQWTQCHLFHIDIKLPDKQTCNKHFRRRKKTRHSRQTQRGLNDTNMGS